MHNHLEEMIMAGCICGKFEVCEIWHHPNVQSKSLISQTSQVTHLQRRPGETFPELYKRLNEVWSE